MSNPERSYDPGSAGGMMTDESERSSGVYMAEHWLAYLFALAAIVFGVLGLLRGFGLIGDTTTVVTVGGAQITNVSIPNPKADAFVWLLPAIASAMLAFALHSNDYHRRSTGEGSEAGMFQAEHWLAYLFAAVTIVMGALALLVGFDLFDRGNVQSDGRIWATGAIGAAALTNTLHALRHHQVAADEYFVAAMMEERERTTARPAASMREPGMTTDTGDMPPRP
jgi:hypothetical protein